MLTELIDPENLEPGDVIIYPCLSRMITAKIVKKPAKITINYSNGPYHYYKSTKCLVNIEYKSNQSNHIYKEQKFSIDEFNETKYILFKNPVLKVIE